MAVTDPFRGLIDGVLQGHAIAHQLKQQALQEEAYARAKARDEHEAQLQDIEAQMKLSGAGRPVTGNMVEQSMDADMPSSVPGVPGTSQTVKYARPADKNRLLTYKTRDGRTIQTEAYTPDEIRSQMEQQALHKQRFEAFGAADTNDMVRNHELAVHGVPLPDDIAEANGYPKGSKVLPGELEKLSSNAATVREKNRGKVAPGETSLDYTPDRQGPIANAPQPTAPKPDTGPFMPGIDTPGRTSWLPGNDVQAAGENAGYPVSGVDYDPAQLGAQAGPPNPLQAAGTALNDKRREFVDKAQTAGGPKVLYQAAEKPEKQTPEEDYLDAAARQIGLKNRKEMNQAQQNNALGQWAVNHSDPTLRAIAVQSKQLQEQLLAVQQKSMPSDQDYRLFADSLLDHSLSPTQFQELKSGRIGNLQPARVFAMAKQKDPKFSMAKAESDFKAMEKTEQSFTSGTEAGLTRANNNVLEHLGLLEEAGQALDNGNIQAINRIANAFGVEVGKNAKTTYDLIAKKVSAESEKAFVPGGGSAAERASVATDFSSNQSPDQRRNNIKATIHLHDSQQRNLIDQYQRGTYGQGQQQLFTPTAMATRDRLLGNAAVLPKGGGKAADATTIKQFLDANSGDKDKTRKALTDSGWTIPQGN